MAGVAEVIAVAMVLVVVVADLSVGTSHPYLSPMRTGLALPNIKMAVTNITIGPRHMIPNTIEKTTAMLKVLPHLTFR